MKLLFTLLFVFAMFLGKSQDLLRINKSDVSKLEAVQTYSYFLQFDKNINANQAKEIIESVRQSKDVKQLYFNTPKQYFLLISTKEYSNNEIEEIFDINNNKINGAKLVKPVEYIKEILDIKDKDDKSNKFSKFYVKR